MLHQLNFDGKDKVEIAIERLQTMQPDEGYYLCFSGVKDSSVIKALAEMAGVKFDAHYSNTGIDPPECVRFIKKHHPEVIFENAYNKDGKRETMFSLIPKKLMPPTRMVRYCCQVLKEEGGEGRFVVTGVRWAESSKRKNTRHIVEEQNKSGKQIMSTDNLEDAPMFKYCHQSHKRVLNPIIDWTDEEVWEFIREYNVPYCKLYDEGYTRIGCIGCPMSSRQKEELERNPKYKQLYLNAFAKMLEVRKEKGLTAQKGINWDTPEDVMTWWVGDQREEIENEITELIDV